MNRDMLGRRLERRGCEVTLAEGGQEALDRIAEGSFDLVLLDIMMPGIDGLKVLRRLREEHTRADLPIIMATAKTESEDIAGALKLGANDYVTKPLDFTVVLARVRTQLELKRAAEELRSAHRRMKHDLDAAAKIQQALLPARDMKLEGLNFSWLYRPCDELAGDSLGFARLDERHVCLYLFDVSGHGVPAALLSVAVTQQLLKRTSPEEWLHPAEVCARLNDLFPMQESSGRYFTMVYCVLDEVESIMSFVCGGHPGPLLQRAAGDISFLDRSGLPLGLFPGSQYQETTVELARGDRLFLFSDGLNEQENEAEEEFGREGILRVFADHREASLEESIAALPKALQAWSGQDRLNDDLTILGMEIVAGESTP